MAECLWAITAYFNPFGFRSRRANFLTFRRHLQVPLLAVEWAPHGRYELAGSDADRLLQLQSPDLLWQKERLLNLAVAALPPEVSVVAWIDGDVILPDPQWPHRSVAALASKQLVQLFSVCHDLAPGEPRGPLESAARTGSSEGFAALHRTPGGEKLLFETLWGSPVRAGRVLRRGRASGLAWAARRDLLARFGFYDACVFGAGDRALACAAFGRHLDARQGWLRTAAQRAHYEAWAGPFAEAVGGQVGYLEGCAYHLWHGEIADRQYRERHEIPTLHHFDPARDLCLDVQGLWRWGSDKPAMHRAVADFLRARNEDGLPTAGVG